MSMTDAVTALKSTADAGSATGAGFAGAVGVGRPPGCTAWLIEMTFLRRETGHSTLMHPF
jgi:hypothetical protein